MLTSTTRVIGMAACLGLGLALTGCGSSGGTGGTSGGAMTGTPVAHDAWASLGYRLDWRGFAPVPRGERVNHFAIADGFLVVQESGSSVSVLEKGDGSLRWTNQLASRLTKFTGVHVMGDLVYASSQGELIGMNAQTGAITVRQPFARVVNTPPLLSGAVAVYGTAAGEVIAHLTTNGVKLWGFQTPGAIEFGARDVNGVAGVVSRSGDVTFLDPQSGTLYGRAQMFNGTASQPASGDGALFVASLDQSLYAYEPTGAQRWRYRTEYALRGTPVFHAGAVYCEIPGAGLVSLDARTGRQNWACADAGGTVVAERNGMLVVFNAKEALLVDPSDGTLVTRAALPDISMLVAETFVDGPIYAISRSGSVERFVPRR